MQIKDKVLDVPVIQGGMGVGVSLSSLAGAVAANGACGVISSVNAGYDEQDFKSSPLKANLRALDYHIKRAKQIAAESTKKGLVAVNIMTAVSHYEESCKTAVSAGADIIISGAGLPLNLPQFTKGTDTLAAPIVSSGRAARIIMKTYKKHYDVYPDMFIIEGSMAGGHLGFGADDITQGKTQSNDEILSDVLAVIEESGADIPVFVAGGVFDGKDMAHYVNKGAAGVQIATRFIATNECDASDTFKQAVVNAKREDIRIIKSPVGMPARAINSPLLERLDAGETFTARKCNGCLTACKKDDSIPYCISRALIAAVKGDWDNGLFFAGSNADRVDRIMSVQELINEIMTDYRLNKSDINKDDISENTLAKYEKLKSIIKDCGKIAIAFSGGVDSTFLTKVAKDVLGENAVAVTISSILVTDDELKEADDFCKVENIEHLIYKADVLSIPGFEDNPPDRCYICKKAIFTNVKNLVGERGISVIAEGTNVDDDGDYRPGMRAIKELGVRSPLKEAGLTKAEIRELSCMLGLKTWNKPSCACLASRFAYGEVINKDKLDMIYSAECYIRSMGFEQFRVRLQDGIARIELRPADIQKFIENGIKDKVSEKLHALGFKYVSLDLDGYRLGSMNEVLNRQERGNNGGSSL